MAGHDGGELNMTVEGRRGQMADQVGHDGEVAGHDEKQASDRYLL